MKKLFIQLVLLLMLPALGLAQEGIMKPSIVRKATYFDKTPPLRDMPVVLPGERDRSWKDNIIENRLESPLAGVTPDLPEGFTDPLLQSADGKRQSRGPVHNFDGIDNVNGVYPPDTDGDVGPNHYFQMINLSFAIWDKQGNQLYGPVDNSTLWDGFIGPWTGTNDGDPIVLYDHLADRWIASQFALETPDNSYWELVAVSETGDPLGAWYCYAFEFDNFNDYPKLGVMPEAYYATFNIFGSYTRGAAVAFEREKMLAGDPDAAMVYFDVAGTFGIQPPDLDGPPPPDGDPGYFTHINPGFQKMQVYQMSLNWDDPPGSTFGLHKILDLPAFDNQVNGIPQPGTSTKLADLAQFQMYRLQYRNFGDYRVMLTNHTIKANSVAGVRWYELRKESGDWYIYQSGTYAPNNEYRWMGSISMNGKGDIALGYSVSCSTTYPSVRYTGRRAGDPLGEMTIAEVNAVSGTHSQTSIDRWGDYAMMSVDPVDDSTFWFTQEYMKSGWKTRIVSFDFGPVPPPEVDAGADDTICQNSLYTTQGTAIYQQSVEWTTSGDGNFIPNNTSLSVNYIRGTQDIANGGATLTLTAYGYDPGNEATDSMFLAITRNPVAFAGNDTVICYYHILSLNGSLENSALCSWSSDGDGTFDDPSMLHATYTPGPEDIADGTVKLTLTAFPLEPCEEEDSDYLIVTIDPCTGVDVMQQQKEHIRIIPNPAPGNFMVYVEGMEEQTFDLELLDINGNVMFTERGVKSQVSWEKKFNLSYQPKGVYLISVKSGKVVMRERVVVQ